MLPPRPTPTAYEGVYCTCVQVQRREHARGGGVPYLDEDTAFDISTVEDCVAVKEAAVEGDGCECRSGCVEAPQYQLQQSLWINVNP
jgi:hypothetical protein